MLYIREYSIRPGPPSMNTEFKGKDAGRRKAFKDSVGRKRIRCYNC